jgi:hypothetical protein
MKNQNDPFFAKHSNPKFENDVNFLSLEGASMGWIPDRKKM